MLEALGVGAYYAAISLAILTTLLLMRREVDSPVLRTFGWVLSLVGFTTLATLLLPWLTPGPVLGAGGYLGALGAGLLKMHFADLGGFVLAASFLLGGLLLCTDYVLLHLGLMLGTLTVASVIGRNGRRNERAPELKSQQTESEDEYEEEEEEEEDEFEEEESDEMPVRVGGRRLAAAQQDDEMEEEDEEEEEYEDEELEDDVAAESDDEYSDEEEYDDEEEDEEEELPGKNTGHESSRSCRCCRRFDRVVALIRTGRGRRRISPFRVHTPPEPSDREAVMNELDSAALRDDVDDYELPTLNMLSEPAEFCYEDQAKEGPPQSEGARESLCQLWASGQSC